MAEWDNATDLKALAGCGADRNGQDVVFGLVAADGSQRWFRCAHSLLHKIVDGLRTGGRMASEARRGSPAVTVDQLIYPYKVVGIRPGRGEAGDVAVQFSTTEGIPVTISMTAKMTATLISKLQDELGRPPPTFSKQ